MEFYINYGTHIAKLNYHISIIQYKILEQKYK